MLAERQVAFLSPSHGEDDEGALASLDQAVREAAVVDQDVVFFDQFRHCFSLFILSLLQGKNRASLHAEEDDHVFFAVVIVLCVREFHLLVIDVVLEEQCPLGGDSRGQPACREALACYHFCCSREILGFRCRNTRFPKDVWSAFGVELVFHEHPIHFFILRCSREIDCASFSSFNGFPFRFQVNEGQLNAFRTEFDLDLLQGAGGEVVHAREGS